jgi:hypothetical protein
MRHEAVIKLYPNVHNQVNDKAYDVNGNEIILDEDAIAEEVSKIQLEWNSIKYQRDRETSYPSIQEQLDMQYWDRKNGTNKWEEFIDKVKADNPKPE